MVVHRWTSGGRRARAAAQLTMLAALLTSAPAAVAGTLDQHQEDGATAGAFLEGPASGFHPQSNAQTFTAGITGGLDRADLLLVQSGEPGGNVVGLTVEIRDTAGREPGSTVLASAQRPPAAIPRTATRPAFVPFTFTTPAPVSAGTRYALVAYTGAADAYHWRMQARDPYPAGSAFYSESSPPSTWTDFATEGVVYDTAFRTYVTPADTTAPVVTCSAAPAQLKSNNHKLIAVATSVDVGDDESGPAGFELVSVTSSQPGSGAGGGDVPNDVQGWTIGTADTRGRLRQERYRTDRVYTLTYQGSDDAGNTATCRTTVTVDKGRRGGS